MVLLIKSEPSVLLLSFFLIIHAIEHLAFQIITKRESGNEHHCRYFIDVGVICHDDGQTCTKGSAYIITPVYYV